jgi:hypothetical protein
MKVIPATSPATIIQINALLPANDVRIVFQIFIDQTKLFVSLTFILRKAQKVLIAELKLLDKANAWQLAGF